MTQSEAVCEDRSPLAIVYQASYLKHRLMAGDIFIINNVMSIY